MDYGFSFFKKFKRENSERILEEFRFLENCTIESVEDVETTTDCIFYEFVVTLSNGEVFQLFSFDKPKQEEMKGAIQVRKLDWSSSQNLILLKILIDSFGSCYMPLMKIEKTLG